jgi:uncharacterized membrane protein YjjB (DUF3815 family)
MNDEQIRKIIDGPQEYEDSKEDTLCSMLSDFYSRKMLSTAILVWVWGIIFMAGAVYSAVKFFATDQTKDQIMYAAIFICLVQFVGLMKVFAWQMIARNSVKREIKRLELRIAELPASLAAGK